MIICEMFGQKSFVFIYLPFLSRYLPIGRSDSDNPSTIPLNQGHCPLFVPKRFAWNISDIQESQEASNEGSVVFSGSK